MSEVMKGGPLLPTSAKTLHTAQTPEQVVDASTMRCEEKATVADQSGSRGSRKLATMPVTNEGDRRCEGVSATPVPGSAPKQTPSTHKTVKREGNTTVPSAHKPAPVAQQAVKRTGKTTAPSNTPTPTASKADVNADNKRRHKEATNHVKFMNPGNCHKAKAGEQPKTPVPVWPQHVEPPQKPVPSYPVMVKCRVFMRDPDYVVTPRLHWFWYVYTMVLWSVGITIVTIFGNLEAYGVAIFLVTLGLLPHIMPPENPQEVQVAEHNRASDSLYQVLGNNGPIAGDAAMQVYKKLDRTQSFTEFWCARDYTHYVDVEVPQMFLHYQSGSASQIVSSMQTETALYGVAIGTLGRDAALQARFSEVKGLYGDLNTYQFYSHAAALFLSQQHSYTLYQQKLSLGKSLPHGLTSMSGSGVNF